MAGFRRSTWFALGLLIGGLLGVALGLFVASGAASSLRRRGRGELAGGHVTRPRTRSGDHGGARARRALSLLSVAR